MTVTVIDPKADPALSALLRAATARGVAYSAECVRRRVKFLPKQAMRPVYEKAGLGHGPVVRETWTNWSRSTTSLPTYSCGPGAEIIRQTSSN